MHTRKTWRIYMSELLPSWRAFLLKALHVSRSKKESKYIQLATVDSTSAAQVRTVVFRGWHGGTSLTVHSDARSNKNYELLAHPRASVCWYFAKTREQFRFNVEGEVLSRSNAAHAMIIQQHWKNLSESAQAQYNGEQPGAIIPEPKTADVIVAAEHNQPHENFTVLVLKPIHVDYLLLKGSPQTRIQFFLNKEGQWLETRVNP